MIDPATLILLTLIIGLVFYFVIVKALFLIPQNPYMDTTLEQEEFDESLAILESLSELEVDYKMGKVTTEDYEALQADFQKSYIEVKER